jgi:peroxiredoxin
MIDSGVFFAALTPQQANRLFLYADWTMLAVGLMAFCAAIGWLIFAALPRYKGRRGTALRKSLASFLVFALFWITQASLFYCMTLEEQKTALYKAAIALPAVVSLLGLFAAIGFGARATLRATGKLRVQSALKSLLWIFVFCAGLAPHAAALLAPYLAAEDHGNRPGTLTRVGESSPDFELATVEGTPFRTADLRGKVIVLNFFATWCGPCQKELPQLQEIWDDLKAEDDFRMLAVGREESNESLEALRKERGFTLPMASDPNASVYRQFATQSIPRTYLISRQGTIVYQWTGAYDEEIVKLKRLLRKELAKKPQ